MTLGNLIKFLEGRDQSQVIPIGFHDPHSYRGYYEQLAFEPKKDACVADMLDAAKSALGRTFCGYKGGDFLMNENTICNIAYYGCCGSEITGTVLGLMFQEFNIVGFRSDI